MAAFWLHLTVWQCVCLLGVNRTLFVGRIPSLVLLCFLVPYALRFGDNKQSNNCLVIWALELFIDSHFITLFCYQPLNHCLRGMVGCCRRSYTVHAWMPKQFPELMKQSVVPLTNQREHEILRRDAISYINVFLLLSNQPAPMNVWFRLM